MPQLSAKKFFLILKVSFRELRKNDPLRLAGATAFFTTFALPPILIILVQVIGALFRVNNLNEKIFGQLAGLLGSESASQIRSTFFGFTSLAKNWFYAIGGFVFLIFVATTLFKVIKDSINQLWNVKTASSKPILLQLVTRGLSLIIILLAGILFLASILAEGMEAFLRSYTGKLEQNAAGFLNEIISNLISLVLFSIWFSVLLKVLPDAKVQWKVVLAGGFFTSILFTVGKLIIRYMLTMGNLNNIFGASGSIVLLLLFVFYNSFILYYGACFTKVFAAYIHHPIQAADYAISYKLVETEGKSSEVDAKSIISALKGE